MILGQANELLGIAGTPDEVTGPFSCLTKRLRVTKRWRALMKENHPDRHVGARDGDAVNARAQLLNAAKTHIESYFQEVIDLTMDDDDDAVSEDSSHSEDEGRGRGGGNRAPASVDGLGGEPTKKKARTGKGRDSSRSDGQSVGGGGAPSRTPKFAQLPEPPNAQSELQKNETVYLDMWFIAKIEEGGVELKGIAIFCRAI